MARDFVCQQARANKRLSGLSSGYGKSRDGVFEHAPERGVRPHDVSVAKTVMQKVAPGPGTGSSGVDHPRPVGRC